MARDNDAYVRSVSNASDVAAPAPSDALARAEDEPSEEDVAAFDRVFAQFDPNGTGKVLMKDFLSIIDELDELRPRDAEPLLSEGQREQAVAFMSNEQGVAEMTRDRLFDFIKELAGNKIIMPSPKKKPLPPRKEPPPSPTKSDASGRSGSSRKLTGISAKSQIRPPQLKRRTDLEKMNEGTTNVIAEHEDFSAVIDPSHSEWLLTLQVPVKATAHAAFNKSRRNVTTPIITSTPYPRRTTSPIGDPIEGYGMGHLSPTSPINSPPLRPQDWREDKRLQDYVTELSLQKAEELKRLQDQERQASVRLREQDTLINELQEKLDLVEDELKDRKKELDKLRTNESRYYHHICSSNFRMQEIVRSMEKEVEARELELSSWRDRYNSVKKSYDEQLAEADKLRDMILNKEGENNVLKEKINSLQEDIDTVRTPPSHASLFYCFCTRFCSSLTYQFIRVSWQFAGERQTLHNTIATLEADLAVARKAQHALSQKELEARQLSETVERLKFELEEMRKRVNSSEHGTVRSNSMRSLMTIGTFAPFHHPLTCRPLGQCQRKARDFGERAGQGRKGR